MLGFDRFGYEVNHAGFQAALAVGSHGVGGHGNDRRASPTGCGLEQPGGIHSIHFGHLHVHQNGIETHALRHGSGYFSVSGNMHTHADFCQYLARHLLVEFIVFRQQHLQTGEYPAVRLDRLGTAGCKDFSTSGVVRQQANDAVKQG